MPDGMNCTYDAIEQIDQLLGSILDAYEMEGEARLSAAFAVLSWLFTNVAYSRVLDLTQASRGDVLEGICTILKAEATTSLLGTSTRCVQ